MNGPEGKLNFVSQGTLHKGLCYVANEEKLLRVQIHGSKSQRAVDIHSPCDVRKKFSRYMTKRDPTVSS